MLALLVQILVVPSAALAPLKPDRSLSLMKGIARRIHGAPTSIAALLHSPLGSIAPLGWTTLPFTLTWPPRRRLRGQRAQRRIQAPLVSARHFKVAREDSMMIGTRRLPANRKGARNESIRTTHSLGLHSHCCEPWFRVSLEDVPRNATFQPRHLHLPK